MRKLYLCGLVFLTMAITPVMKAQDTGPCSEVTLQDRTCDCDGFKNTVIIQACDGAYDQHCSPSYTQICCLTPRITFPTNTQGNDCSGPRIAAALNGLPEGQEVYVRNCNGLYIAVLVHHSKAV